MIIIMASATIANAHIENWGKSAFLQKGDESNFGGDSLPPTTVSKILMFHILHVGRVSKSLMPGNE